MHEHIEMMMAAVAAKLRREPHRTPRRRRGPRRARGTFVPVRPDASLRLAH
ncbi:hypothetical protein [Microbacterium flavescens]|jgi:hypothetical protein|uniref:hypothetical protein n=1 Tax=Microbacterium flavescens TaxID=69366 RepID=UPI001BDE3369|nr:hypothetical protein [Microbacterium flavescens]